MDIKVIVLADRLGKELQPLDQIACPALLDAAGRAVIEYTLEDLARSEIKQALVVSAHTDLFEKKLRRGGRWGLELEHLLSRGEQTPDSVLRRIHHEGPVLLVRGDVVRGHCIKEFLDLALASESECVAGLSHGRDAGVCLVRGQWNHGANWRSFEGGENDVELGDIGLFPLSSLKNFHAASIAAVSGQLNGVALPGRESEPNVTRARQSANRGAKVDAGKLYIGLAAQVEKGAEIIGQVSIGERAYVDECARLENCVVMPGTYVGKDVEIKNAIVAGNRLIRVDINAIAEITDDFLLTSMDTAKGQKPGVAVWERLLAVVLLVTSLPLWALALIISVLSHPTKPMGRTRLIGNKPGGNQVFVAWRWNTRIPVLRRLPRLLSVIVGHIGLVGIRPPLAGEESNIELQAPAGLLGPALLEMEPGASEDEIALAETIYASRNSLRLRLGYLIRGAGILFTSRAWKKFSN